MDRAALPPTWLEELIELLQTRRRLAVAAAGAVVAVGLLVALVAPSILPATAGVGAAVGIAACLLAVAAVVGLDAGDLTVRGARHVRAAGADVVAVLDGPVSGPSAESVVARFDELGARRVALVPASEDQRHGARALADGLGEAWARAGRRVLVIDVSASDPGHPGIVEVAHGEVPLGQAVTFDPEVMLARLGAGRDLSIALAELPALAPRLPADIERTVVALPPLIDPSARGGAGAVDDVYVVAVADATSRVDLLATLEALDVGGVDAQVLLLRPERSAAPTPVAPTAAASAEAEPTASSDDADGASEADEEPQPRGPRPVPAARERDAGPPTAEGSTATPEPSAAEPAAAPLAHATYPDASERPAPPAPSVMPEASAAGASAPHEANEEPDDPTQPVPVVTSLLGLDRIDREVEAEAEREAGTTSLLTAIAEHPEPPAPPQRPLRAVAHREIDAAADEAAQTVDRRPLRAVSQLDRTEDHDAFLAATEAPVPNEDLATTAVLETLAQEIWSRENLGGTA